MTEQRVHFYSVGFIWARAGGVVGFTLVHWVNSGASWVSLVSLG